ncbi:hypothetical protein [Methylobacter sp.]|uniref:hypothetical protein n=1 Tax=Methylobacter sp. TaxID=2051955 RepID=UPI001208CAFD|nr:hypothetical protein [Methylobacter sp.]TAK59496.1 MAG: hypothetical protein EPO18_20250 [Methylobacter sp.]
MKRRVALKVCWANADIRDLGPEHLPNKIELVLDPTYVVRGYKRGTVRRAIMKIKRGWPVGLYRFGDGAEVRIH